MNIDMRQYAEVGARAELQRIFEAFPTLRAEVAAQAVSDYKLAMTAKARAARNPPPRVFKVVKVRPKPKISAAGRKRISEAQKARWAAIRAEQGS